MSALRLTTLESDVRRIWAAVRFVDAGTSRPVDAALNVVAAGVRWVRNRDGAYVALQIDETIVPPSERPDGFARELSAYQSAFDPVPTVTALQLRGRVSDPAQAYLPRLFSLELPRASAQRFVPVDIALDPAPAAPVQSTWAVLRVGVSRAGRPAAFTALRLVRRGDNAAVLGRGMSDARGEALVVAAGIRQVTVGGGTVVIEREVESTLIASFDATAEPGQLVDPDDLAARAGVIRTSIDVNLASGRVQALAIDLP